MGADAQHNPTLESQFGIIILQSSYEKKRNPTNGCTREHVINYLLRRQPANTLCHVPGDPRRWAMIMRIINWARLTLWRHLKIA
jgi:hypothetical protein